MQFGTLQPKAAEQKAIDLNVWSETGRLRSAIVHGAGNLVGYHDAGRIIKALPDDAWDKFLKEEKHHHEGGEWKAPQAKAQVRAFHALLRESGVELIFPEDVKGQFVQFFTRDMGFVIGDTFYISNRTDEYRKREIDGISEQLRQIKNVVHLTEGRIEGGDVMVDGTTVYVGTSAKTNPDGYHSLKEKTEARGFEAVQLQLKRQVLHLDCRFNIIGDRLAIVMQDDFSEEALQTIKSRFEIIEVSKKQQKAIPTNVFLIAPKKIASDLRNAELNRALRGRGFEVHEFPFDEVTKLWGSFRCCVLPLFRD
ncbi:MAG TPA: arginine deiminase family protein [Candidatus Saccharimonadales bacterium]|nr:arginine deiminase family protein [Candidatus Saccharimonadales bacterium]